MGRHGVTHKTLAMYAIGNGRCYRYQSIKGLELNGKALSENASFSVKKGVGLLFVENFCLKPLQKKELLLLPFITEMFIGKKIPPRKGSPSPRFFLSPFFFSRLEIKHWTERETTWAMEASKKKQKAITSFFSKHGTNAPPKPKSEGKTSTSETNLFNERERLLLPSSSSSEAEMETDSPSQSDDKSEIPIKPASKVDETDYNNSKSKWPCICTREMWDSKKVAFPWLDCQNGKLGCTI
ncbi:hypothetical protein AVEN_25786-1 [Araneus ventricosus]|uniref:Uncharacterized protein n=1 Tax=Araneus ventricosus TaxID=182803 RepID=A0A4Y2FSV6_ARAVE|nr:hypothetical protein AVEN_25786-1 [Araneus ventricosus]